MNDSTLRLKKLAEAATPGPWEHEEKCSLHDAPTVRANGFYVASCCTSEDGEGIKDAAFIAAANPEVVLGLIARIEELEKQQADKAIDTLLNAPQYLIQDLWCEQPALMQQLLNLIDSEIKRRDDDDSDA